MGQIPAPVLVTGATGFIGSRLCARFRERGIPFLVLTRHPEGPRVARLGAQSVYRWDADAELAPAEALSRARAVVHLAGESVAARWTVDKKRKIRDSRLFSTRNLVTAMIQAEPRPQAFVCASAVGFYGSRGDEALTEESAPGHDFLAQVCGEWELGARRAEDAGIRAVSLRIGLVLDRGGGALGRMLLPFRLGLGGRLGGGQQWMSWIHRDDLAGLILFALEEEELRGPVNATAPNPVRNAEFTKTLGRVLHRPTPFPVPAGALRLLVGEFAEALLGSQRVMPELALKAGYRFQYPTLEAALRAALGA